MIEMDSIFHHVNIHWH